MDIHFQQGPKQNLESGPSHEHINQCHVCVLEIPSNFFCKTRMAFYLHFLADKTLWIVDNGQI